MTKIPNGLDPKFMGIVSTAISQTRLAFLPPSFTHVPNSSCPYLVPAITREGNDFGFYRNPAS